MWDTSSSKLFSNEPGSDPLYDEVLLSKLLCCELLQIGDFANEGNCYYYNNLPIYIPAAGR